MGWKVGLCKLHDVDIKEIVVLLYCGNFNLNRRSLYKLPQQNRGRPVFGPAYNLARPLALPMPVLSSGPIAIGVVAIIRAVLLGISSWHAQTRVASSPQRVQVACSNSKPPVCDRTPSTHLRLFLHIRQTGRVSTLAHHSFIM